MSGEVSTRNKRRTAVRVQKIEDQIYTDVDIEDAPQEIQDQASALLGLVTCCEPSLADARGFNGFGDDMYWQFTIVHEALVYEDGRPVPHGRTTTVRISDRG